MLAKKKIVLCDRYYLSTIAYQGAAGVSIQMIIDKNAFAPEPDIALLFQLPPQISIQRITQKRGDNLNDFEQEESLRNVEKIFNSLTCPFIKTIDADRSIEVVHRNVLDLAEEYLTGLRKH
jgi:dTMP kinase